jgi:hypothetical protein
MIKNTIETIGNKSPYGTNGGGGGGTDHSVLTNLNYSASNHTGFQPTLTIDTVANAEARTYNTDDVILVLQTNTLYKFQTSTLTRDGLGILNTGTVGTRLLAIAGTYILGTLGNANTNIRLGTTDAFGRNQIWNSLLNAIMRLGSLAQDGDPLNTSSEGIIAYGTNSNGAFAQNDWAYARIKSTRFGLLNCIANVQNYIFRVDELGMYLRNDAGTKTFEVTRSTGAITTPVGIGTTPNASAILDVASTTKAFIPPRMTTVQRDAIVSPVAGMVIYNITINALNIYNGTVWASTSGGSTTESIMVAVSDETTILTSGVNKLTFRMPYAFTLTSVRASLNTASSSGVVTVDINETGTSILSTKLTIDQSEKTSTTASIPVVISDSSLSDDAEITIDIDTEGLGAKGLKVVLIGTKI